MDTCYIETDRIVAIAREDARWRYGQIRALTDVSTPSNLRGIKLPALLERRDNAIRLRGHRITLYAILTALTAQGGTSELSEFLTPDDIATILKFWAANEGAVSEYMSSQQDIARRHRRLYESKSPSLNDLRERFSRLSCK